MEIKKFSVDDFSQTREFAQRLAARLSKWSKPCFDHEAVVVALTGDLGSGKTSFARAFAEALGVRENVTSPTFVIQKKFQIPKNKSQTKHKIQNTKFKNLVHIDAYRTENPKEILDLGWEEIIANSENIVLVEWAERIKEILPKNSIQINFKHLGEDKRKITIKTPEKFL